MDKSKKVVVTLSGGADSAVLLYKAAEEFDEIYTVTFDYGQRHSREMLCAVSQIENLRGKYPNKLSKPIYNKVLDVFYIRDMAPTSSLTNDNIDTPNVNDIMGEAQPKSYVPFRNMMFLSILCAYAEAVNADEVWYGAAQADSLAGYWDSSEEFVDQINKVTALNREHRIKVKAPLIEMSKKEIIEEGIRLGVKFEDTYTCYSGLIPSDAESASSSLRLKGFIEAGFIDPILYVQQDRLNEIYKEHECKMIPGSNYTAHMRKGYPSYMSG